jgi:Ca2+-transporting ATPase
MLAERAWTPGGEYVATGSGYDPQGSLQPGETGSGAWLPPELGALLRDVVLCNDADLQPPDEENPGWRPMGDPTEAALLALAAKGGRLADPVRKSYPRVAEIPFDSVRKRMTTVHATVEPDRWLVVCKGAPEVLLGTAGMIAEDSQLADARNAAARLARDGYRVLAVAHRVAERPGLDEAEHGLRLAGLIAITDPPRANAGTVIRSFRDAGVDLLLVTGDHPHTACALAERLGIDGAGEAVVTGAELEAGLSPARTEAARVFARTRPEQKLDIVRSWQDRGHVVAMTGDGVNDGPALRRADIGVAMGRDGTEVARQAADLVLTDDDLGTVVAAIGEGRRIYANVRTFLRYALSGGVAEVVVMLLGPLFGLAVPLLPAQILWINMLTHGLPGVALGAEPADPDVMHARPRSPQEFVLGGGLWRRIAWTGLLIAGVTLGVGWWSYTAGRAWQTMIFLVLGLAQLGVAVALRRRGDGRLRFLDVSVAGAVLLQVAGVFLPPLRALLGTEPLGAADLLVAVIAATVPGIAVALQRWWRATAVEVRSS